MDIPAPGSNFPDCKGIMSLPDRSEGLNTGSLLVNCQQRRQIVNVTRRSETSSLMATARTRLVRQGRSKSCSPGKADTKERWRLAVEFSVSCRDFMANGAAKVAPSTICVQLFASAADNLPQRALDINRCASSTKFCSRAVNVWPAAPPSRASHQPSDPTLACCEK